MKIEIRNVGLLGMDDIPAKLEIGDLTIVTGCNNSGKTYAAYSLFGLLDGWVDFCPVPLPDSFSKTLEQTGVAELDLESLRPRFDDILDGLAKNYCQILHQLFGAGPEWFSNANLTVRFENISPEYSGEYQQLYGPKQKPFFAVSRAANSSVMKFTLLREAERPEPRLVHNLSSRECALALFRGIFPHPHIISSERSGAALFQKELDINKNILTERIQKTKDGESIDHRAMYEIFQEMASRYAVPIRRNIDTIRDTGVWSVRRSFLSESNKDLLRFFDEVANGSYKVVNEREIVFLPKGCQRGDKRLMLPLFLGSTSVRALLDLHIYLKHLAQPGDMLLMDEPELNLHPDNQRKMARLLARMVNAGIRVFITTHSDYLIKEINNLIMLHQLHASGREVENLGYDNTEFLSAKSVRLYQADKGHFVEAQKDELGFVTTSFDEAIADSNKIQDTLTSLLQESKETALAHVG